MARKKKNTKNEPLSIPSFLTSPPTKRASDRATTEAAPTPQEDEVDAVMQSVMEAAGVPSNKGTQNGELVATSPAKQENPSSAKQDNNTGTEPESEVTSAPMDTSEEAPAGKAESEPVPVPEPTPEPEPTLEEDLATLASVERKLFAHRYASAELETFGECLDPPKATADRAEALAVLVEEDHELLSDAKVGGMLERLASRSDQLEPLVAKQVQVLTRDRHQLVSVPASMQARLVHLQAESYDAWLAAKATNDWRSFAPYLDRMVSLKRKLATAINPDADPYDTLLDIYEPGTNRAFYNKFFARVKQCVVPLLSSISMSGRTLNRDCVAGRFDVARQWELARDIAQLEGIDEDAHYLTSTEHPFSEAMTSNYAVTAAHVDANDITSNVFTMLHEIGHNLYEQGVDASFNRTSLKGGTSMGMHEAQSRFFENYVGRAKAFVPVLLALMKNRFPGQLSRLTPNQLYRAINNVSPSLIRVDADELTYPLHILIRYEIEQLLLAGKATAREVPGLWAKRYQSYIGANVTSDTQGALQDVHWAQGMFGYFPTYALGNAYAAQLRAKMIDEGMDWERVLASGDLTPIRTWLHKHVWRYGRSKDPAEIIQDACGEPFNPRHYANYLTHKFTALYNLR